MGEIKLSETMN